MKNKKLTFIQKYNPFIFILFSTLFMSVGYAIINSITLNITGEIAANSQEGIFITDYTYITDNKEEGESSEIVKAYGTLLNSNITLSSQDNTSQITYRIKLHSSYNEEYLFDGTSFSEEFYSNENITYEISNIQIGDKVQPKSDFEIDITFKYKDGVVPTTEINNLSSFINFRFIENKVTITYDANGGKNEPEKSSVLVGQQIQLSSQAPTQEGYKFIGWSKVKGDMTPDYQPGDIFTPEENMTLYAVWEYISYYVHEDFEDNDINSTFILNTQTTTINSTDYKWSVADGKYRTNTADNGSSILSGLSQFSIISEITFTPIRNSILSLKYAVSSTAWTSVDYSIILTGSDGSTVVIIDEDSGNATDETTASAILTEGVTYKLTLTHKYPKWYKSTYAYIDDLIIKEQGTYVVNENFEDTTIDEKINLSTQTTTVNGTQYKWSIADGRYRTNTASNGSSSSSSFTINSTITFTPTTNATLSFTYGISSTAWSLVNYSITLTGTDGSSKTLVNQSSGNSIDEQTVSTDLNANVTYTLNLSHSYPKWYSSTYAYIDNLVIH